MPSKYPLFLSLVAALVGLASAPTAKARAFPIRFLASIAEASPPLSTFQLPTGPNSIAHSHNDFAQERPLDTALEEGYTSLEVDVTDRKGEVAVVHLGVWTYGTLKEMYLDRLQRIVDEKGSIHGDGRKFTLWIETRPFITSAPIVPFLRKLLESYSMLTVFDHTGKILRDGPVEAVIINEYARDFFDGETSAPACLGTSGTDRSRAPNKPFECWNYLRWSGYFDWDGNGEIPGAELKSLNEIQSSAHARGLRTRFWGAPETPAFWKKIGKLPFDLIGTDDLKSTMDLLLGRPDQTK